MEPTMNQTIIDDILSRLTSIENALAQELPAPSGALLDQVTAAVARGNGNRFPDEHYRPLAKWAVRAVIRWLSDKELDGAAAVLRSGVERD
jgi:hypothetical protein